jgi:hypothetical protein
LVVAGNGADTAHSFIWRCKIFRKSKPPGFQRAVCSVFGISDRHSVNIYNGKQVEMYVNEVTDGFREVLDLHLVQGRWFDKSDDGMN